MPDPMTAEERELRLRLDESVRRIRSSLAKCPFIDELDYVDGAAVDSAAFHADEANEWLRNAESCTEALATLRGASEDATVIAATSRCAMGVVREVLTVLTAAIDCSRAS